MPALLPDGEDRLGHRDQVGAIGQLGLQDAQGHRIDGNGRGGILVRAVQLLPAGKGQIVRVRLARIRRRSSSR